MKHYPVNYTKALRNTAAMPRGGFPSYSVFFFIQTSVRFWVEKCMRTGTIQTSFVLAWWGQVGLEKGIPPSTAFACEVWCRGPWFCLLNVQVGEQEVLPLETPERGHARGRAEPKLEPELAPLLSHDGTVTAPGRYCNLPIIFHGPWMWQLAPPATPGSGWGALCLKALGICKIPLKINVGGRWYQYWSKKLFIFNWI